jgi:hypothetical protein
MDLTRTNPEVILDEGLKRAMERCRREMPTEEWRAGAAFQQARALLSAQECMNLWGDWQDRGSLVFVELVAIGVYARTVQNEPPLNTAELTMFSEWIKKILNSYIHP